MICVFFKFCGKLKRLSIECILISDRSKIEETSHNTLIFMSGHDDLNDDGAINKSSESQN